MIKKILEEQNLINAIKADIKILKKTREKLELLQSWQGKENKTKQEYSRMS